MEYSLLKQIVPNRSYFPLGIATHPTHYPGFDCINPGIGNVASPYSYFVPSHFITNPNLQVKQKPQLEHELIDTEQAGKGTETSQNVETESEIEGGAEDTEKILSELNAKQKKLLDKAIYESFLHPKRIKTETVQLKPSVQKLKVNTKGQGNTEKISKSNVKEVKHKFKFE